ncbi:hypothetical protein INR49_009836 [Caranx melampygus]|nr:hypothetical protein INR49_009836 [Caranx melampygus]
MLTMEAAAMDAPHCWTPISATAREGWSWERINEHVRCQSSVIPVLLLCQFLRTLLEDWSSSCPTRLVVVCPMAHTSTSTSASRPVAQWWR